MLKAIVKRAKLAKKDNEGIAQEIGDGTLDRTMIISPLLLVIFPLTILSDRLHRIYKLAGPKKDGQESTSNASPTSVKTAPCRTD